ncbi:hypothetical protein L0Y65_04415 [Candidatus Micrarchaeota archaeon]|nr:hypothetical protein [Candidatus Micrarchaeota archaeon]
MQRSFNDTIINVFVDRERRVMKTCTRSGKIGKAEELGSLKGIIELSARENPFGLSLSDALERLERRHGCKLACILGQINGESLVYFVYAPKGQSHGIRDELARFKD